MLQQACARWIWERLQKQTRPIVLYGMGDGADKALACLAAYGISIAGVFASDAFVRGQIYRGYQVQTLAQLEESLGEMVVLLCFATERPDVLLQIEQVAERHTLLVPDFPVCGEELFTPAFCRAHMEEIQQAENLLADEWSRLVLRNVLAAKLTGEPHLLRTCESDRSEVYSQLLPLGAEEIFFDAGAYTGDTVEEFVRRVNGQFAHILAAEPDKRNFAKLLYTVERLGISDRTECIQAGIWSGTDKLPFLHRSGRQAALSSADRTESKIAVDSVDHLLAGRQATLLKFDVEGAEREALLGSADTIRTYRPKLAVAAYHRREDLFALVLLIHQICPHYRIFLRHHPYLPGWETNLYCTI